MAELGLEGVSGLAGMPMNSYDKILILNNNMALCNFDTNICKWFDVQCPRVFLCCFWFFFFFGSLECSAVLLLLQILPDSPAVSTESSAGTDCPK